MTSDWWDFNMNHDNTKEAREITDFLGNKVLPFLDKNRDFSLLVSYLPIEKWMKNKSFSGELLVVAVGYAILGQKDIAYNILKKISSESIGWSERVNRILKEADHL
jgi:hypothetical protein